MSDNKSIMMSYLDEVLGNRRYDDLDKYFHKDVVLPDDMILPDDPTEEKSGIDVLREHHEWVETRLIYSDTVEDIIAEGDKVVVRMKIKGTQIADFLGVPNEGRSFSILEIIIVEFRDGKISQLWRVADVNSAVRQLRGGPASRPH